MENRSDLLTKLLRLARPLSQEIDAASAAMLAETRLTVRMRSVLEVLKHQGPLTVPAIARHLQIQRQYAQVMINEVTGSGFAVRGENPVHRRSDLYTLTEPGVRVIDGMAAAELAIVDSIASNFGLSEVDQALTVLESALNSYRRLNDSLRTPEAEAEAPADASDV